MRASVTYELRDLPDDADPNAVLAQGVEVLNDAGFKVASNSVARFDQDYTVVGVVKGQPERRWREVVKAESYEEAEAKARNAAPKGQERTVAASMRGDVTIEDGG